MNTVPDSSRSAAERRSQVVAYLEAHGPTTFVALKEALALSSTELNNALRRLSDLWVVYSPARGVYAFHNGHFYTVTEVKDAVTPTPPGLVAPHTAPR